MSLDYTSMRQDYALMAIAAARRGDHNEADEWRQLIRLNRDFEFRWIDELIRTMNVTLGALGALAGAFILWLALA